MPAKTSLHKAIRIFQKLRLLQAWQEMNTRASHPPGMSAGGVRERGDQRLERGNIEQKNQDRHGGEADAGANDIAPLQASDMSVAGEENLKRQFKKIHSPSPAWP